MRLGRAFPFRVGAKTPSATHQVSPSGGGTTNYPMTMTATQGQSATLGRNVGAIRTVAQAQAVALVKGVAAGRTTSNAQSATLNKNPNPTRTTSNAEAASLVKKVGAVRLATQGQTPVLARAVAAIRAAGQGQVASRAVAVAHVGAVVGQASVVTAKKVVGTVKFAGASSAATGGVAISAPRTTSNGSAVALVRLVGAKRTASQAQSAARVAAVGATRLGLQGQAAVRVVQVGAKRLATQGQTATMAFLAAHGYAATTSNAQAATVAKNVAANRVAAQAQISTFKRAVTQARAVVQAQAASAAKAIAVAQVALSQRITDTFNRTVASGNNSFGTADSGQVWDNTFVGTGVYQVNGTAAMIAPPASTSGRKGQQLETGALDGEALVLLAIDTLPVTSGGNTFTSFCWRVIDNANMYRAGLLINDAGLAKLRFSVLIAGANTNMVGDLTLTASYTPGDLWWVRAKWIGSLHQVRVWKNGNAEPVTWTESAVEATNTTGTKVALVANGNGTQTNSPNSLYEQLQVWLPTLSIPARKSNTGAKRTATQAQTATLPKSIAKRVLASVVSLATLIATSSITGISGYLSGKPSELDYTSNASQAGLSDSPGQGGFGGGPSEATFTDSPGQGSFSDGGIK